MRSIALLFLMASFLVSHSQDIVVKGKINLPDSTMIIMTDGVESDTAYTIDKHFYLSGKARGLLSALSGFDRKDKIIFRKDFFADGGEVTIDSSFSIHLSNTSLQLKYEEFRERYALLVALKNSIIRTYIRQKRTADQRLLFDSIYNSVIDLTKDMIEGFIKANKNNLLGPYIFVANFQADNDSNRITRIYNLFNEDLLSKSYALQMMKAKIDLMRSLIPGNNAPFFLANSADGKEISLTSLKGKFAVLDYWATWCQPCVLGLPRMKQYYQKYKSKVEFISIACHDDKTHWHDAIKKFNLDWPQVFNYDDKDQLESKYDVAKFPTKVIIDPEGHIVKIFTGELDDFYLQLDSLLNPEKTAMSR